MAFSQGFTPHPRVSYAGAAPTGAASEAEYLEIAVTEFCDPVAVAKALDEALPPGLDIVAVVEATAGSLADRLEASEWEIHFPEADPAAVAAAASDFLAAQVIEVERMTKKGLRTLDARSAVVRLEARGHVPAVRAVVRHETPTVRPDDIVAAFAQVTDLPTGGHLATRRAQGLLDAATGGIRDPFG